MNPSKSYNFKAYTEPLHFVSCIFILIAIFSCPVFLYLTFKLGKHDPIKEEFTFGKAYVYQSSTLTMRSWSHVPVKFTSRIALFSILFFGTLIFWHWEAMLISHLATKIIVLPFTNIRGLLLNSDVRIALLAGSYFEDSFRYSTDQDWKKAYKDRIQPHLLEYNGLLTHDYIKMIKSDGNTALYDTHFSVV